MKKIPLSQGKFTFVDDEDYEWLNQRKWHYSKSDKKRGYARCFYQDDITKKDKTIAMHRVILDAPKGMEVDHINGDSLDNRRSNIRICTRAQNAQNNQTTRGSSKYKGVYWRRSRNKWGVTIGINGKTVSLGSYVEETNAAKAYDKAARKYFGEFAHTNF